MATSEFGKAFAAARKAGDKTFEFKGKKYTTQLASEVEQPSVGGKVKPGEYKPRDTYSRQGQDATSANYTPRRTPEPLTSTDRPGTATRYENEEATSETFKKGGKVGSASKRADGCAQRGKTKGRMV